MGAITGRAFIKLEGKILPTANGAKLNYGNNERAPVVGDQGVRGFSEKPTAPMIEATIQHAKDVSLDALSKVTDTNITFEADSGATFILSNAWLSNALELTANENGDLPVTFHGLSCEEA
ncbi:MAG: hypothetical protein GKR93_11925 [Gammaproteobacteria bacterium]|nr:hypothetical protein [Gammaproteobacteria bacterium]